MAARGKARGREAQLAFEAVSIEGGLLSPDWLSRAAQLAAGGQSEADYRVPKGLNLRDEIGRFWRIAQAHWTDFASGRFGKAEAGQLAERFVVGLLRDSFGFATLARAEPVVLADRRYPIGFAALGGRVPVIIAPAGSGLDTLSPAFCDGTRRRSAFGLTQEYLNAEEGALWGFASDGIALRIVRDNASLTRPAWIETDLHRVFTEERYADFAALWLLAHETRFGRADQSVTECSLEVWRNAGREEGTRAREHLRLGVEDALVALGQGFLAHPDNQALRAALQTGDLSTKGYFNQLLRLVYRLIFLLTVEERGVLHPDGADEKARSLYATGYSLRRLRERAVKRNAHDRFPDLWEATKVVFRGVAIGEPRLGLPPLGGIFGAAQCLTLDAAKLENRALLLAVFKLSWLREDSGMARVNWRDMGPEELGSVYESLLELVPQITLDGRQFAFATGGETKGNARKTTGSYYTPDTLVQVLLDSALEPVIAKTIASNPERSVAALLELSVVDPACGSGHFLLAAARRLAAHVARLQANGTPSAAEYRHALRQVVGRCIYGVDLNPMAVELCKVSLWMEAVEPGLPLTFLNSHIRHGNALLGTTPGLMADGIPNAAWDAIEGDDKRIASALKKRNKKASEGGQRSLDTRWSATNVAEASAVALAVTELDAASDASPEALANKESRWDRILGSAEYQHQKFVADAWCAAFVWPKRAGELADAAPTNELWRQIRDAQGSVPALTTQTVESLTEQYRFFHWHLQFPQVFAKGGFDVALGNPPWDSLRLLEKEFFAVTRPDIAAAPTSYHRKALVAALEHDDVRLHEDYKSQLRFVEGTNALVVGSGGYPLCGGGRVNLFGLFAELARGLTSPNGRYAQILPAGVVADDSTKQYFHALIEGGELVCLFHFENEERVFPGVHHAFRFVLIVADRAGRIERAELQFFSRHVSDLSLPERRFSLTETELALVNPKTRTCPLFRSRRDANLNIDIYRRVGTLSTSAWNLALKFPLDVGRESIHFRETRAADLLPLYEGKYFHQYDHLWLIRDGDSDRPPSLSERVAPTCAIKPRYWFPTDEAKKRYGSWRPSWMLAWRDIARCTDERTVIASVVPSIAVAHTAWIVLVDDSHLPLVLGLLANLNSIPLDYLARQKVSGTHVSSFVVDQLPIIGPSAYTEHAPWDRGLTLIDWLRSRVLELVYTTWDMQPFAHEVGHEGPPFRWEVERRFLLRCELDAAFFHLYGLSAAETDYVLDTFPVVRRNDEKVHGEYRTKRVILEIHAAMDAATRAGKPYQARLDPPPVDTGGAHTSREQEATIVTDLRARIRALENRDQTSTVVRLPLYDLRAAAGPFEDTQEVGAPRELSVRASRPYERRRGVFHFVAQIIGRSMEPVIPDGSYCIFRRPSARMAGSRVLVRRQSPEDPERGGRFVVKEYRPGNPSLLVSLNPDYPPFAVTEEDIIEADFVEVAGYPA